AFFGNKLPIVAFSVQSQLQHSKGIGVSGFAIWFCIAEYPMAVLAAASHHKFPDTACVIQLAVGVLWREALVVMIVSVDDNICVGGIKILPEGFHLGIVAVSLSRAE